MSQAAFVLLHVEKQVAAELGGTIWVQGKPLETWTLKELSDERINDLRDTLPSLAKKARFIRGNELRKWAADLKHEGSLDSFENGVRREAALSAPYLAFDLLRGARYDGRTLEQLRIVGDNPALAARERAIHEFVSAFSDHRLILNGKSGGKTGGVANYLLSGEQAMFDAMGWFADLLPKGELNIERQAPVANRQLSVDR